MNTSSSLLGYFFFFFKPQIGIPLPSQVTPRNAYIISDVISDSERCPLLLLCGVF